MDSAYGEYVPHSVSMALPSKRNKERLILVRGMPGSGKSTFAKEYADRLGIMYVESDMYFYRNGGGYQFDINQLRYSHGWCLDTVKVMLMTKGIAIVSNTFTQFREMKEYVDFCKEHDFGLDVFTMNSRFQNIHNVPEDVLKRMSDRFHSHESIIRKIGEYQ